MERPRKKASFLQENVQKNLRWMLKKTFLSLFLKLFIFSSETLIWKELCNTGCPNKHGNSVTNSISSLIWISFVIPDIKSHNIIMSARVYFMKTVNGCKYVSIMSPQDKQWRRTSLLCLYTVIFLFY